MCVLGDFIMSRKLLEIKDLHAGVADRQDKGEILRGLNLEINAASPLREGACRS